MHNVQKQLRRKLNNLRAHIAIQRFALNATNSNTLERSAITRLGIENSEHLR